VAALAAGMLYNVQVFSSENGSDTSMIALGNMAVAQAENGGGCVRCHEPFDTECYRVLINNEVHIFMGIKSGC